MRHWPLLGATFNRSFIILDEGQNATDPQIRMLLTRLGFGSKMVITGDLSQTDLPRESLSGLSKAVHILKDIDGLSVFSFHKSDIVRHPIVKEIVNLYEKMMTSKLQLDSSEDYPPAEMINSWVQHVGGYLDCIFNIECVSMGAQEMASLNGRYRNKYKPTNILFFTI